MSTFIDRSVQLRVARHTRRLGEVVAFYRDGVGLPEIGRFQDHAGYDGVFLEVTGTGAHLEFTSGGIHDPPEPNPESLLVLYVGNQDAMRAIAARLGTSPVPPANPYWANALTFSDPDGFRVVVVPDHWDAGGHTVAPDIVEHRGPRRALRRFFELAEDSARALEGYIDEGRVLVALDRDEIVGHVQITETPRVRELEIKNLAVDPMMRRRGIGRALVEAAAEVARDETRSRIVVATGAADIGNLLFYQRLGFRMRAIERDAFSEAAGYEPGLTINGIALRDRVWLDRELL
jgi:ribosomal protein S18 acetylase RimI-like enzyme